MKLEGIAIDCRIVETVDPEFDPNAPGNREMVLVRKLGFSLNYRDRAYVLGTTLNAPAGSFAVLGSEFVGEVLACGPETRGISPGARVIANNSYPSEVPGTPGGLPGNNLSKELQAVHVAKLARVPDAMSNAEAAAFSIGAQTTFSMVRKLAVAPGSSVLVTGGRSNTSLFAIHALQAQALDPPPAIYVSTTSEQSERTLRTMGIAGVIRIDREAPSFADHPVVKQVLEEHGGFDAVVDPFYDVHLRPAVAVMRQGGRYSSCGRYDQTGHLVPHQQRVEPPAGPLMSHVMFNNLQIIGNCLGPTVDLESALAAYSEGRFPVVVDSVFSDGDAAGFLDRTYNAPDRFGKVVYLYC